MQPQNPVQLVPTPWTPRCDPSRALQARPPASQLDIMPASFPVPLTALAKPFPTLFPSTDVTPSRRKRPCLQLLSASGPGSTATCSCPSWRVLPLHRSFLPGPRLLPVAFGTGLPELTQQVKHRTAAWVGHKGVRLVPGPRRSRAPRFSLRVVMWVGYCGSDNV